MLENVIFVHQEESNWPLAEGKVLKVRGPRGKGRTLGHVQGAFACSSHGLGQAGRASEAVGALGLCTREAHARARCLLTGEV